MRMEIPLERWQSAQEAELANWERTLSIPRHIVAEMADAVELDGFIVSVPELRELTEADSTLIFEVGVGPLGLAGLDCLLRERLPRSVQ